jgi:two-component system sensor histidine kinase QseC
VPLDLVKIATEVVEELALGIAEKDIALSLNHDEPRVFVSGHEVALTAMFRNLIENALRYTPVSGHVDIDIAREGTGGSISICDDGPGIPIERRQAAFQRFYRGAQSNEAGFGLGLSIVQRAVELHDGAIALLEAPSGKGLLVRISIAADPPG